MPKLDQQFEAGSIVRWHKQEGDWVKAGDDLFDFKVEEIKRFKRVNARNPEKIKNVEENTRNWSWLVRVTASDEGYLRKTYVAEKETCVAEDLLAVLSVEADTPLVLDEKAVVQGNSFQVVGNILENHQSFD
jgi:pyruvate/2-oxoglutarate dehydrogenase complex dihydrolipoamide acyltransferase (E2) component